MPADTPASSALPRWLLLLGLLAVSLNLRPALTGLGPLLAEIKDGVGLSASAAGVLTTLPVLCLGLFGPLAPWLSKRMGTERTVMLFLVVLGLGCALRAWAPPVGLYVGTVMTGAGIGVIGVLLPGLFKREFPDKAAQLTGVYTMVLGIGAGIAAGVTAPLTDWLEAGWRGGLLMWALPVMVALALWLPQLRQPNVVVAAPARPVDIWRDKVAWQVTLLMGLQSSMAYSVFGWLPYIFQTRGLTAIEAGLLLSISTVAQLVTALGGPVLGNAFRDQRPAVALFLGLTLTGLLCSLFAPLSLGWLWVVILGLGQGGLFSVALSLIVLRARDAHMAGRLSGMAQGVGYTLAAAGPLLVGVLYDWRGDWLGVAVLFCVTVAIALVAGLGAGRRRFVGD